MKPSKADLERMIEDAKQATPGPWCYENCGDKCNDWVVGVAFDKKTETPISGLVPQDECDDSTGDFVETVARKFGVAATDENLADARHIANHDPQTTIFVDTLARDVIEACEYGKPNVISHGKRCGCPWCAIYDRVTRDEP